jgi:hypothetical protein
MWWLLTLAVIWGVGISAAQAECRGRASSLFYVNENDTTDVFVSAKPNEVCRGHLTAGGSLAISSIVIKQQPRNGRASVTGAGGTYVPRAGFVGNDFFIVSVCGRNNAGSGCSTIRYHVTVAH